MRATLLASCFSLLALAACETALPPEEGFVAVEGGRIFYDRMGNGPGTPLIVIHGGPGSTSFRLKAWAALGEERPVYRYDQLGSGRSDRVTDTTLFTVDHFVEELQALRDSLGLDEVHLYGRSWGAMLVQAYMATKPSGVKSVILSSPLVTTAQWAADADSLILALPDSMQQAIARAESLQAWDDSAFKAATDFYYDRHLTRKPARVPADADSGRLMGNDDIYGYMWGPTEFTATGTLKDFDATGWLREFTVPTLFVTGEYDEATPASTERFSKLVPGAEFAVIPDAGHSTENDNWDELLRVVREFIARVEGR
jgi:proline iminopeptidase